MKEVDCSSRRAESSRDSQSELFGEEELAEVGSSRWLRMCPESSQAEMASILRGASESYSTSGLVRSDGRYSTLNTWDGVPPADGLCEPRPSDVDGSLYLRLSDILEKEPPEKYSLSSRACAGILRRAEKRGKTLPPMLEAALRRVASADTKKESEPSEVKEET